ncbi:MAG: hypothetical protein ACYCYO_15915 [Bacilli bacterium]
MSLAKEELYHLIDALPENEVVVAKRFLEFLLEVEERMDNVQLEREFGYRADAPCGKFVEKPPGMSFGEFYEQYREGRKSE